MTSKCPVKDKCIAKANSAEYRITMCSHGASEWNDKNLFCGWYNANLNKKGHDAAKKAGIAIRDENLKFDVAYASVLKRSQDTLHRILFESGQTTVPIHTTWRLNERHYGELTGQEKLQADEIYGREQVLLWRRSYDVAPPEMTESHPNYDDIVNNPIFDNGPPKDRFPKTESLKMCTERCMPFWYDVIIPQLKAGKSIIISAHVNSLRAFIKNLERMTPEQTKDFSLPKGVPFQYKLDGLFKPIGTMRFMGDPETVKKAMEEVANSVKRKD